ncbi:hypothetical protein ABZ401_19320 [Streptomyces sp. NPDC005892]|uniref:hypothetical protein n=1 Tax=Streptomyces sp. NPDC005892 TaxID=3155593 RepID=UPI0033D723C4
MPRRLSAKAAQAIIDGAELVKALDWSNTRRWHVDSGGQTLVIIEPSYRGGNRSGWTWRLPGGSNNQRPEPTREQAAVQGLMA